MSTIIEHKEMSLDSSLFSNLDKSLTKEEYIEKVISLLQPILDRRFSNCIPKQKIRLKHDRINFSCPYCGDSMKDMYKKRGNIILEGKWKNYFKCHNCGEFKRIDRFFKDYNTELGLDFINYIASSIVNSEYVSSKYDVSLLLDVETIENYAIGRQDLKNIFGLIEVKGSPVWPWLVKRCQFDETKFLYSPKKNYLAILNLTPKGNIIGLQQRLLVKTKNKYMTYKLSKLYELIKKEKLVPDWLDSISQIYNICLVNFSKPITLFEGPFDAFLFKNSIANTGANKELPIEIPIRYFYDDDETGRQRALEKINEENSVFLWSKLKQEYELPIRKKWDLNDFIIWCKENNKSIPNFNNYFSTNSYDALDI